MAALNQFTVGFLAIPSVNKHLVIQLARCEYVDQRENCRVSAQLDTIEA